MLGKIFGNKKDQLEKDAVEVVEKVEQSTGKKKGIVGNLKDKAIEKMMEKQLKALPAPQREMLMNAIKSNPDFFESIAKKIEEEQKKNGGNQMAAAMKVMRENQKELSQIMMGGK